MQVDWGPDVVASTPEWGAAAYRPRFGLSLIDEDARTYVDASGDDVAVSGLPPYHWHQAFSEVALVRLADQRIVLVWEQHGEGHNWNGTQSRYSYRLLARVVTPGVGDGPTLAGPANVLWQDAVSVDDPTYFPGWWQFGPSVAAVGSHLLVTATWFHQQPAATFHSDTTIRAFVVNVDNTITLTADEPFTADNCPNPDRSMVTAIPGSTNRAVLFYHVSTGFDQDAGSHRGRVVTVESDGSLSFGSPSTFDSSGFMAPSDLMTFEVGGDVVMTSPTRGAAVFTQEDSMTAVFQPFTVSGTTITFQPAQSFNVELPASGASEPLLVANTGPNSSFGKLAATSASFLVLCMTASDPNARLVEVLVPPSGPLSLGRITDPIGRVEPWYIHTPNSMELSTWASSFSSYQAAVVGDKFALFYITNGNDGFTPSPAVAVTDFGDQFVRPVKRYEMGTAASAEWLNGDEIDGIACLPVGPGRFLVAVMGFRHDAAEPSTGFYGDFQVVLLEVVLSLASVANVKGVQLRRVSGGVQ